MLLDARDHFQVACCRVEFEVAEFGTWIPMISERPAAIVFRVLKS
jgi:hypothetical protein